MRLRPNFFPCLLTVALCSAALSFAAADTAKGEANRKKPLQRCDEVKDDHAQLQCLQKARQRVVEARKKREESDADKGANDRAPEK